MWDNGTCEGTNAPENGEAMRASLWYAGWIL
jgi:hypothetical protein